MTPRRRTVSRTGARTVPAAATGTTGPGTPAARGAGAAVTTTAREDAGADGRGHGGDDHGRGDAGSGGRSEGRAAGQARGPAEERRGPRTSADDDGGANLTAAKTSDRGAEATGTTPPQPTVAPDPAVVAGTSPVVVAPRPVQSTDVQAPGPSARTGLPAPSPAAAPPTVLAPSADHRALEPPAAAPLALPEGLVGPAFRLPGLPTGMRRAVRLPAGILVALLVYLVGQGVIDRHGQILTPPANGPDDGDDRTFRL